MSKIQIAKEDHGKPGALGNAIARASRSTAIEAAVTAERERCAKLVPTNWCDPLLSGEQANKVPLDCRGVEALLRGIQDRIRKPL